MQFLYWLESIRNPFMDSFFAAITHLGSETLFIVLAIVIFWCVNKRSGYYLMSVGFFGTLFNQFLKLACRIPRPWVRDPGFTIVEAARADATGYSFPSGHTQSVTAVLGCPARATKKLVWRIVCVVLIILTAFSRMYLGVHTPADVGVSLLLGGVMIFAFYPLFEKGDEKPALMYGVMGALFVCSVAFVLYTELHAWPADIDPINLEHGLENSYLLMGCSAAMVISCMIERRFIRFETKAKPFAQVLKVVLGLALVLAIKEGTKPVLNALFNGHPIGRAFRYFLMVMFAACVWPLTFPWFQKGCPMTKGLKKAIKIIVIAVLVIALLAGFLFWQVTRDTKAAPVSTDDATNPLITPVGMTMLSGHRAGGGIAPENTMMALKNCAENTGYQVDIFEFDIHLTMDGVPVLVHDSTLDRTSDAIAYFNHTNVRVQDKTLAELKNLNMGAKFKTDDGQTPYADLEEVPDELRIITLEEALGYLESQGEFRYIIEVKNGGDTGLKAADILYDTLVRFDCLERTVVGTFNNEVTEYIDLTYPDMPRSAGFNEAIRFYLCSLVNWPVGEDAFNYVALQIPTTDYT
ncbi:MAG: phosphatase PAP2 family protein, partial [Clostridia bacterium]|nr:phosphatase PAP2 family protein [Clostridia bacterium]